MTELFSCYIILSVMKKMSDKEALIKKLYRAVNLMACESKLARDYGTPHELTASDIDFLKCVEKNAAAKASDDPSASRPSCSIPAACSGLTADRG